MYLTDVDFIDLFGYFIRLVIYDLEGFLMFVTFLKFIDVCLCVINIFRCTG